MSVPLKFKFPVATLTKEGDYILTAAEAHATAINARLPAGKVAALRTLLGQVSTKATGKATAIANLGTLTQAQNDALKVLHRHVSDARKSARLAFPGQDVKLKNEFLVGKKDSNKLATTLLDARTLQAACAATANAAALAAQGWIAADTAVLDDAINTLNTTDDTQEGAKGGATGATGDRNVVANDLYDGLLAVQNAAHREYPEEAATSINVRKEFRLVDFPPAPPTPPAGSPPPPAGGGTPPPPNP